MSENRVSASRDIAAEASTIFDLLSDPAAHHRFDGSGTVVSPSGSNPERLFLGARFGMSMRMGVPYRISNEVVEFEQDRLIGWRHMGRHVWRYELEPLADGGTRVTETFDWKEALGRLIYPLVGIPQRNLAAIEATLDRLASLVEVTN